MKQLPQTPHWSTRCGNTYACQAQANGTFLSGPDGWLLEKLSAGVYEITHNMARTDYVAIPFTMVGADYKSQAEIQQVTPTTVRVGLYLSAQPTDMNFGLLVMTL